jgi:PAS domain S-box-containing protein
MTTPSDGQFAKPAIVGTARRAHAFRWIVIALGSYALAGGVSSFLGWVADVRRLTDWDDNGISIQPNASVVAALAGAAILLLCRGHRRAAAVSGAFIFLVGAATLFEFVTGAKLGIDTLLMFDRQWGRTGTLAPGRMGPPGSVSWTLVGLGLIAAASTTRRHLAPVLGLCVVALSALSLIGYLFGADLLYTLPRLTVIANQTASFLFAVGLALIASVPERNPMRTLLEDSAAGQLAREALPALIVLPVVLGYLRVKGQDIGLYDTAIGSALMAIIWMLVIGAVLWRGVELVGARERTAAAANEAQARAEARLRMALIASNTIAWHWDLQTGLVTQSDNAAAILGSRLDADQSAGWNVVHPDDAPRVRAAIDRAIAEHGEYTVDTRIVRPDNGDIRWMQYRGKVESDTAGKPVRIIGTAFDITDRKAMEEELRSADRRKDEFVATLAHELRNPLAPVAVALEFMKRAEGDVDRVRRARETMQRQVDHMVRLIDDLLDVSRITRDNLELRRERVALAVVIQDAIDASRPLIERAEQVLTVALPHEPVHLHGDPTRLTQVFANLLNNACKYTPPGREIFLTARTVDDQVEVSVRDTGIGMDAGFLPRAFEMFSQADSSLERRTGGLGIGLTLVKRLVEMHGGTVTAHSEGRGAGSEFVVRLPLAAVSSAPDAPAQVRTGESLARASRRILIVDDNRDSTAMLAAMFGLAGHQTETAHDGHEALTKAEDSRPDVIILDIGLPGISGYDVCRAIRQTPWGRSVVIVALTGWGQDEDRRRSTEAGFDAHLVKPVTRDVLLNLMDGISISG